MDAVADVNIDTLIIDSTTWADDEGHRLYYVDHFPVHSLDSILVYTTSDTTHYPTGSKFCHDDANGWISFEENTTAYSKVEIYYSYSSELDLVIGNDGPNVIFYNGSTTGSYSTEMAPIDCVLPEDSCALTGQSPTASLMDTASAIGLTMMHFNEESMKSALDNNPNCKTIAFWNYWRTHELYRGLFSDNYISQSTTIRIPDLFSHSSSGFFPGLME